METNTRPCIFSTFGRPCLHVGIFNAMGWIKAKGWDGRGMMFWHLGWHHLAGFEVLDPEFEAGALNLNGFGLAER